MHAAAPQRRVISVLLVAVAIFFMPGRANAMYMEWQVVERPIDWRVSLGSRAFGIAEEVHVKKWFLNRHDGREVLSVGTGIHFGFGAVTAPCRLPVFMTGVVGAFFAVVMLAMLPSLRRRWGMSRVSVQ